MTRMQKVRLMKKSIIESRDEKPTAGWKKILAPTDFSERSQESVRTATNLAEQCGGKITLLHVVQFPALSCPETELAVDEVINSSSDSLSEIANGIPTELINEKLVRLSEQGIEREIIETARRISADLIVIATHGHSQLERVLLGSTAEKVVRHAPCPVLVARTKEGFSKAN